MNKLMNKIRPITIDTIIRGIFSELTRFENDKLYSVNEEIVVPINNLIIIPGSLPIPPKRKSFMLIFVRPSRKFSNMKGIPGHNLSKIINFNPYISY